MSHYPNESSYSSRLIGSSIPRIFFVRSEQRKFIQREALRSKKHKRNNCYLSKLEIAGPLPLTFIFRLIMGKYGFSVYIGGISDRVRTGDVEDFLKGYGKILDISLKSKYGKN